VLLVQMPYGNLEKPSMALGLLKAILAAGGISVEVDYCNLEFARQIGIGRYHALSKLYVEQVGEWTFAEAAFPDFEPDHEAYVERVLELSLPGNPVAGRRYAEELWRVRRAATGFIDRTARRLVAKRPAVVACSSMFQQHCAALALLRRVKELDPRIRTALGGANCEGPMGVETVRSFPWLDAVVSGEADELVVDLFTALLGDEDERAAYVAPPGVYLRDAFEASASAAPAVTFGRTERLDHTPPPEFSDYFSALAESGLADAVRPGLVIETSRGCWWGERRHCTFCGLNGGNMGYRSKDDERVMAELDELSSRHRIESFQVVDNILDMAYFKGLLPALAARRAPYDLFYETKPNLTRAHLEILQASGVRWLQPGIESLHDTALEAMAKGTTGLINVRLLKWSRELGLTVYWNILHGIPNEDDGWYREMSRLIPSLVHLQPPQGLIRIRYERFSPYHSRPQDFGLELRPAWPYRFIYPLAEERLENLVYRFDDLDEPNSRTSFFDNRSGLLGVNPNDRPGVRELRLHLGLWRRHHADEPPILRCEDRGDETVIVDTRPCTEQDRHVLRGLAREVHRACANGAALAGIVRVLREGDAGTADCEVPSDEVTESAVEAALNELEASRLVVRLGNRWLALALDGEAPALPPAQRFPGGFIDVLAGSLAEARAS
jgi:magnesium-protoporphyrin IX monomethyl ester (oxidative) cyclase